MGFWRRVLRYVADWVNDRFQTYKFSLAFSSNVSLLSWTEAGSASSFNGSAIVEHSVQRVRYCFFPPLSSPVWDVVRSDLDHLDVGNAGDLCEP